MARRRRLDENRRPGVLAAAGRAVVLASRHVGISGGSDGGKGPRRRRVRSPSEGQHPEAHQPPREMPADVGWRHTRVTGDSDGVATRRSEPALQFVREQQVGELAHRVALHPAVALRGVEIVEGDPARPVREAAHRHDARSRRGEQSREQVSGQREVAQVVHAELGFEAIRRQRPGRAHDAGVVDEAVEAGLLRDPFGGPAHGSERAQVQLDEIQVGRRVCVADSRRRPFPLGARTAPEQHPRALPRQHFGRLETDAAGGPGDEDRRPGLIRNAVGRPDVLHHDMQSIR